MALHIHSTHPRVAQKRTPGPWDLRVADRDGHEISRQSQRSCRPLASTFGCARQQSSTQCSTYVSCEVSVRGVAVAVHDEKWQCGARRVLVGPGLQKLLTKTRGDGHVLDSLEQTIPDHFRRADRHCHLSPAPTLRLPPHYHLCPSSRGPPSSPLFKRSPIITPQTDGDRSSGRLFVTCPGLL